MAEHEVSQSTLLAKLHRLGRQWKVAQLANFFISSKPIISVLRVNLVAPFLDIIDQFQIFFLQYYNISPGLFKTKSVA